MLLHPLPSTDLETLYKTLADLKSELTNLRNRVTAPIVINNAGASLVRAEEWRTLYISWVHDATGFLVHLVSRDDLQHLLRSRSYNEILSYMGSAPRVLNNMLDAETKYREQLLSETMSRLNSEQMRWHAWRDLVVFDSGVYLNAPKLEDLDFQSLTGSQATTIHLIIPIVVLDELDRMKTSNSQQRVRWRAGYTLAVIDRIFEDVRAPRPLQKLDLSKQADGIVRPEVTAEILMDEPNHIRRPSEDDEIVDRAVWVKTMSHRQVTLATYDTGQSSRARWAGLNVIKLNFDYGEEPQIRGEEKHRPLG